MADTFNITHENLRRLFASLRKNGYRILAPVDVEGRTELGEVEQPSDVHPHYVQTLMSAKSVVFPKVERLMSFKTPQGTVELMDQEPNVVHTVLFGLRPCEARGFIALDAVFNWDTKDRFFNSRLDHMAIVSVSCTQADDACFCTAVGGGPSDARGSDILLTPMEGGYTVEVCTEKGNALKALCSDVLMPPSDRNEGIATAKVEVAFDSSALTQKLSGLFESNIWEDQALRCIGCGACAFVCPTCVCFDIQEEADRNEGQRLRCWDSCGYSMFTLHASGHNPRDTQSARWRQRILHKFSYYPERYQMLGCVGCGKCTRACPVDMNLKEHLVAISEIRE